MVIVEAVEMFGSYKLSMAQKPESKMFWGNWYDITDMTLVTNTILLYCLFHPNVIMWIEILFCKRNVEKNRRVHQSWEYVEAPQDPIYPMCHEGIDNFINNT